MWRNSPALPLAALVIAVLGAVLIVADLALRSGPHSAPSAPASSEGAELKLDGRITEGEYAHNYRDETTGMELYWTVAGEEIYFGLRSPGSGWAALALAPEGPMMQGGDIVIGYVSQGELHIQDGYADGPAGHKADTELGGEDDILEAAGSEGDLGTVIEFRRKLDTGDRYDHAITTGEMAIQLAYSDRDDFASYHAKRATITLQFLEEGRGRRMIPEHLEAWEIGLITWTFLLALFGLQGLISVFLEGEELEPGEGEEREGSPWAMALLAGLLAVEVALSVLFARGLYTGARVETLALYGGGIFLALAAMLIVYRRSFLKDEVIVQEREDDFPW